MSVVGTLLPWGLLSFSFVIGAIYIALKIFFINGVPCRSRERLEGKTVIITGANSGIGKVTATELARRGAQVILACRDKERGEAALKEIKKESGSDNVVLRRLDLASLKSIREFTNQILREETQIHILIDNAGAFNQAHWLTEDGFEVNFGVHHLGHFLLTNLLLDRIKESAPSRIIVVSSIAHGWGELDFEDMMWRKTVKYNGWHAYARSKLANVMFARELAKRTAGTGVTVCALHPGSTYTPLFQSFSGELLLYKPIMWVFFKNLWQGSQTIIHCAVAREVEGVSGKYWDTCAIKEPSKRVKDDEACKKLWEYSAELVGLE